MVLVHMVRIIYWLAAVLCMAAAVLVTASMPIAEHGPQTVMNWGVTVSVSTVLAFFGFLAWVIAHHLSAIGLLARTPQQDEAAALWRYWSRLSTIMILGGIFVDAMLLAGVYAIFQRIGEGFAVFG